MINDKENEENLLRSEARHARSAFGKKISLRWRNSRKRNNKYQLNKKETLPTSARESDLL